MTLEQMLYAAQKRTERARAAMENAKQELNDAIAAENKADRELLCFQLKKEA